MEYKARYVSDFYDALEQGKIPGQYCRECGGYQTLLAPCCRHCQSMNLEDVELAPKGQLMYIIYTDLVDEVYRRSGRSYPMPFGAVLLDEGPVLFMEVQGIKPAQVPELNTRCPLPVRLHTEPIAGNYVPVAKIEEEGYV